MVVPIFEEIIRLFEDKIVQELLFLDPAKGTWCIMYRMELSSLS
jgi:hypothetical protein